jgi:2-oxoisovalerate dehydrogenase E2 component (dihydrolipoyl transacylase)
MARYSFRLPDIGEGIAEAEIVAWHVKIGERVEEDAQLADMMTDKATVEMESPVSGIVVELAGEVGDLIPIGSTLAVIETDGEAVVDEPPADTPVEKQIEAETPGAEEAPLPLAGGAKGGNVGGRTGPPPTPPASGRGEKIICAAPKPPKDARSACFAWASRCVTC